MDEVKSNSETLNIEHHANDLEHGITEPEHMKCFQLRLNSFKHQPSETYKGVWPSRLARAGFYFDPRTSETVCYCCRIRIPASWWKRGTNPIEVHRRQSPDYEHITGQCEDNVSFHTKSKVIEKLSYLEPSFGSSRRPTGPSSDTRLAAWAQRNEPPFQSVPITVNPGSISLSPDSSASRRPVNQGISTTLSSETSKHTDDNTGIQLLRYSVHGLVDSGTRESWWSVQVCSWEWSRSIRATCS